MCYLVREKQFEPERGSETPRPSRERLRPRWIGLAVATLIGGFAFAALVLPPSAQSLPNAKDLAAPAPVSASAVAAPLAGALERTSVPADDGVPTSADGVKSGMSGCEHGL